MNIAMKHILRKYFILSVLLSVAVACDDDFGSFNLDPDAVTDVDPGMLFSQTQVEYSAMDMEPRTNYCHAFMQYGYSDFWSGTEYSLSDGISSRYWNSFYSRVVKNLEYVINYQLEGDDEMINTLAAAKVWRVFIYQKLTDFYGSIPYSEAGKAFVGEYTPKYDAQDEIYNSFIAELREAISMFDASAGAVRGDQFFANSDATVQISRWKKFANSLLLRIGMRLVKVDATRAGALVAEAVNGGVMESLDDMPVLVHSGVSNGYNFALEDQHFFLHSTLVEHMKRTGDPRLDIYGAIHSDENGNITSTDTTQYEGYVFGVAPTNSYARISYPIFQPGSTPFFVFHYAQVEFLLAEAVLRNFISGNASEHYQAGIRAHMKSLSRLPTSPEVTDGEITAYLVDNTLTGTTDEQIELINTEFWVSGFVFDADEVWANWRRTGYPALTPNPETLTGSVTDSPGRIPRKMPYPQSEFNLNSVELTKALSTYGNANDFNVASRVWWDVE